MHFEDLKDYAFSEVWSIGVFLRLCGCIFNFVLSGWVMQFEFLKR